MLSFVLLLLGSGLLYIPVDDDYRENSGTWRPVYGQNPVLNALRDTASKRIMVDGMRGHSSNDERYVMILPKGSVERPKVEPLEETSASNMDLISLFPIFGGFFTGSQGYVPKGNDDDSNSEPRVRRSADSERTDSNTQFGVFFPSGLFVPRLEESNRAHKVRREYNGRQGSNGRAPVHVFFPGGGYVPVKLLESNRAYRPRGSNSGTLEEPSTHPVTGSEFFPGSFFPFPRPPYDEANSESRVRRSRLSNSDSSGNLGGFMPGLGGYRPPGISWFAESNSESRVRRYSHNDNGRADSILGCFARPREEPSPPVKEAESNKAQSTGYDELTQFMADAFRPQNMIFVPRPLPVMPVRPTVAAVEEEDDDHPELIVDRTSD